MPATRFMLTKRLYYGVHKYTLDGLSNLITWPQQVTLHPRADDQMDTTVNATLATRLRENKRIIRRVWSFYNIKDTPVMLTQTITMMVMSDTHTHAQAHAHAHAHANANAHAHAHAHAHAYILYIFT